MKENIVFKSAIALLVLFCLSGCEIRELVPEIESDAEVKSATLTDLSKVTNDDALALEMMTVQIEPVSAVNDLVKYEYYLNQLVTMNYYKRRITTATDVASAFVPVQTDKFSYNPKNRITDLVRIIYNTATTVDKVPPTIKKKYLYDRSGRLTEIITKKASGSAESIRYEYLYYNSAGQMIKKVVRGENISFLYEYDKSGNLVKELEYSGNLLRKITLFFYTPEGNVMYKQFLRPNTTVSNTADFHGGIVKYEYEPGPNPFKWMKVPYGSLFESMDELSNHNYIRIATPWREVWYKYEYSMLTGFPLVRYTVK